MTAFSLRDMREGDLPVLFAIQADTGAQLMAAFADTSNDRDAYIRKWSRILAADGTAKKVIVVEDEVIGSISSFELDGETDVTYWIRHDFWGRGIATEALSELLKEVSVRPIFGRTAHDNVGSMRVLESNGFVRVREEESFALARRSRITEVVFRLD